MVLNTKQNKNNFLKSLRCTKVAQQIGRLRLKTDELESGQTYEHSDAHENEQMLG